MISFVYFDVGGVVIDDVNGSVSKWKKMKRDLGIKAENDKEFDEFYNEIEKEICAGRKVDMFALMKEKFHLNFPAGYSLSKDFIKRFEPNKSIWPVINRIKQDCKIGLLTNMYPEMLSAITEKGIMPKIHWDVIIDSSVEGCRKPDLKVFKLAQEKADTERKNILFVDNKIENINVAKNLGWQTFLYDSVNHEKSCSDLLEYYNQIK